LSENQNHKIELLDKIIFGSLVLFLLTLTNSIFLNQLGYYSAIIFILIRIKISGENRFRKTSLEIYFIAFFIAELISAILSLNKPLAFNNLLKRILLIPIIYTIIASADDFKKTKLIFKTFIGAAIFSMLSYLVNAFYYYINNLYNIEQSGPSLFQYPITTSEIMSFVFIILFAFLVNEKVTLKYRILNLLLLGISAAALFSTYKRTGWIGAAAGVFMVIVLSKKWKILITLLIGLVFLIFIQKNTSRFLIYEFTGDSLRVENKTLTSGRASDVLPLNDDNFYLADFQNGIVKYGKGKINYSLQLQSPVISLKQWNDSMLVANLIDTRFVLLKEKNNKLLRKTSFISPGYTSSFKIANGCLYILDSDSGLTVFKNPLNLNSKGRMEIKNFHEVFADPNFVVFYSLYNKVKIYSIKNEMPDSLLIDFVPQNELTGFFYSDKKIYMPDNNCLKIFELKNDSLRLIENNSKIKKLIRFTENKNDVFAMNLTGEIYLINFSNGKAEFKQIGKVDFVSKNLTFRDNKLFLIDNKTSRLSSIFDPYNPSNFDRLQFWRNGFKMFKDYPVFGVGDIDLAFLYVKYKEDYDKEIQGHMHNNYVHILVILGAFGFIVVMALLTKIFLINLKIYKKLKDIPFASSYALGAASSFVAFLVSGLTEWNFGDHEIITLVWFILGLNFAFYFNSIRENKNAPAD
jgi:O-antigen ligase